MDRKRKKPVDFCLFLHRDHKARLKVETAPTHGVFRVATDSESLSHLKEHTSSHPVELYACFLLLH